MINRYLYLPIQEAEMAKDRITNNKLVIEIGIKGIDKAKARSDDK